MVGTGRVDTGRVCGQGSVRPGRDMGRGRGMEGSIRWGGRAGIGDEMVRVTASRWRLQERGRPRSLPPSPPSPLTRSPGRGQRAEAWPLPQQPAAAGGLIHRGPGSRVRRGGGSRGQRGRAHPPPPSEATTRALPLPRWAGHEQARSLPPHRCRLSAVRMPIASPASTLGTAHALSPTAGTPLVVRRRVVLKPAFTVVPTTSPSPPLSRHAVLSPRACAPRAGTEGGERKTVPRMRVSIPGRPAARWAGPRCACAGPGTPTCQSARGRCFCI